MLERARVILASELSIAWDVPEDEALERLAKALV
jgi:hypothetical protein